MSDIPTYLCGCSRDGTIECNYHIEARKKELQQLKAGDIYEGYEVLTPPKSSSSFLTLEPDDYADPVEVNAANNYTFPTGAVRYPVNTRYDLISPYALERLAQTYNEGAVKYGDNNWRKGLPFSNILSHVMSHLVEYNKNTNAEEDHLAHALWGIAALIEQETTHPDCNDLYFHGKKQ